MRLDESSNWKKKWHKTQHHWPRISKSESESSLIETESLLIETKDISTYELTYQNNKNIPNKKSSAKLIGIIAGVAEVLLNIIIVI